MFQLSNWGSFRNGLDLIISNVCFFSHLFYCPSKTQKEIYAFICVKMFSTHQQTSNKSVA
jgi:hypothetical protein